MRGQDLPISYLCIGMVWQFLELVRPWLGLLLVFIEQVKWLFTVKLRELFNAFALSFAQLTALPAASSAAVVTSFTSVSRASPITISLVPSTVAFLTAYQPLSWQPPPSSSPLCPASTPSSPSLTSPSQPSIPASFTILQPIATAFIPIFAFSFLLLPLTTSLIPPHFTVILARPNPQMTDSTAVFAV
jgi:hypothetical protein